VFGDLRIQKESSITIRTIWFDANQGEFNYNGGGYSTRIEYKTGADGKLLELPPAPTRSSYAFVCWCTRHIYDSDNGSCGDTVTADYIFRYDAVVYARWINSLYTITLNPNGGYFSGYNNNSTINVPTDAIGKFRTTDPPTVYRSNYTFNGWYTEPNGGELINTKDKVFSKNTTIYAHWTRNPYTITLNANGGKFSQNTADSVRSVLTDTSLILIPDSMPDEPTRDGYVFDGWYIKPYYSNDPWIEITPEYKFSSNTTISARWQVVFYETKPIYYGNENNNKEYKTVRIGTMVWMAENLNYDTADGTGSWCYGGGVDNNGRKNRVLNEINGSNNLDSLSEFEIEENCNKYGRLYNWNTATANEKLSERVRGICPLYWHLPSAKEWDSLLTFIGKDGAGVKLKSKEHWYYYDNAAAGKNEFGFSALPGGIKRPDY